MLLLPLLLLVLLLRECDEECAPRCCAIGDDRTPSLKIAPREGTPRQWRAAVRRHSYEKILLQCKHYAAIYILATRLLVAAAGNKPARQQLKSARTTHPARDGASSATAGRIMRRVPRLINEAAGERVHGGQMCGWRCRRRSHALSLLSGWFVNASVSGVSVISIRAGTIYNQGER